MAESNARRGTVLKDRISELSDEILICILRCLHSQEQAAQTISLSRRWRNLWRSYPIVEYDYKIRNRCNDLQKFRDATIERFSRDSRLRIEVLKLSLQLDDDKYSDCLLISELRIVMQLLDLASKRKAEEVSIEIMKNYHRIPGVCCNFRSIYNSALKILRLQAVQFKDGNDNLPLSLNSLRLLSLRYVELEGVYTSLIANSPLLETLELQLITDDKIQISNLSSLKNIDIRQCGSLKELDITAPLLETLCLRLTTELNRIELTAPQLRSLVICNVLDFGGVDALISKLPSLKSLTLFGFGPSVKKLKFSSPNLEELKILASHGLSEIELDCGPCLTIFSLTFQESLPPELRKCVIRNAPNCHWMLNIYLENCQPTKRWFVKLKNFIDKYTQFLSFGFVLADNFRKVTFKEEEVNSDDVGRVLAGSLAVEASPTLSDSNYRAFLDGLFWACRPSIFAMHNSSSDGDSVLGKCIQVLLSQHSCDPLGEELSERRNWQRRLKDVKIVMKGKLVDVSKDVVAELETHKRVYFGLNWC
ncbi:F-box/FBD/LRR-repeat protein At1g80470 [Linum perenne]